MNNVNTVFTPNLRQDWRFATNRNAKDGSDNNCINPAVRLSKDPQANPSYKYTGLKDALHWTPNLGAPGFATPAYMEIFNSSLVPRMVRSVLTGENSPEDAAAAAASEIGRITRKWNQG